MFYDQPWYVQVWQTWLGFFDEGVLGWTFGIFLALLVLALAALALYGIFRALDHWFMPYEQGPGRVLDKWIVEGHYETRFHIVTTYVNGQSQTTQIPYQVWVPPQLQVKVGFVDREGEDTLDVDVTAYETAKKDAPIRIRFQRGRLTGGYYIDSYEPV